jgi:transposase
MGAVYVGVDWGSEHHAVCVVDAAGQVVSRWKVPHTAAGLRGLVKRLSRWPRVQVGIERPNGLVVEELLAAGYTVVPIRPKAVQASRARYRPSGSKSDPEDGYILADLLRTDGHRFTALRAPSGAVRVLRARVRARQDLLIQRVALCNQLRAVLESFWPGPVGLFADLDSQISLAFLSRYPTPISARRLGEGRMASFLRRQGYSGQSSAEQLVAHLRQAPTGHTEAPEQDALGEVVLYLVAVLSCLNQQLRELTARIETSVGELEVGRIVMSLPRAGRLNAAQIVAEIGEDPLRFGDANHLAAQAGVVPVTRSSGKRCQVAFRRACNRRLRHALTLFADNSRHDSAWAADLYHRARERGCHHTQAVRILARAWIGVLWRCWNDGVPYQPARHRAAQQLLAHAA